MQITLHQFEQIDGLMQAVLRRPAIEDILDCGREYCNRVYFRPEWTLEDALIVALGRDYVDSFPSALECAAAVVTGALLCTIEVLDEEAA